MKWCQFHPQRHHAGVSLIEVLVALVILGVGLMGLARLQLVLLSGTADTAAYDQAVRLANNQLEMLRFTRAADAEPNSGADEITVQGVSYRRTWTAACGIEQACQSNVAVAWHEPRAGGAEGQRELVINGWLAAPSAAEQGWLVQSGPPGRETLP